MDKSYEKGKNPTVTLLDIKQLGAGIFSLETSTKKITTPFFFPAISSVKTNESISDYYTLIKGSGYPGFLISAYDIYHSTNRESLVGDLSKLTENTSTLTLMDSGNYEAFWHRNKEWSEKQFEDILKAVKMDMCFSYDVYWNKESNIQKHSKDTTLSAVKTASMQTMGTTIPIVHGNSDNISDIIEEVLKNLSPEIIGVTERELGSTLIHRAQTIKKIRSIMDKNKKKIPLHILGTGNPSSFLVYSLVGADLFDGLEWCKNIIDPSNGHVYHSVQKDLFECDCKACKAEKLPYAQKMMQHNLLFYDKFSKDIATAINDGEIKQLIEQYLPKRADPKIKKMLGLHD